MVLVLSMSSTYVPNIVRIYHACQLRLCLVCFLVFDVFNYSQMKMHIFKLICFNRLPPEWYLCRFALKMGIDLFNRFSLKA